MSPKKKNEPADWSNIPEDFALDLSTVTATGIASKLYQNISDEEIAKIVANMNAAFKVADDRAKVANVAVQVVDRLLKLLI